MMNKFLCFTDTTFTDRNSNDVDICKTEDFLL